MDRTNLWRAVIMCSLIAAMMGAGLLLWMVRPSMMDLHEGERQLERGNYLAAASSFDLARAREPRQWRAWEGLAIARLHLGRYKAAVEAAERLIELRPGDASAWYVLGYSLEHAARTEAAIDAYRRSIELGPTYKAWISLAHCLFPLGRNGEAADALEKGLALDGGDPTAWIHLGACYLELGRHDDALMAYGRAIEIGGPEEVRYRYYKTGALIRLGRLEEAASLLQTCASDSPSTHAVHCRLGDVELRRGRPDAAIESLELAMQLNRLCIRSRVLLVQAQARDGRFEAVRESLDRLRELEPRSAEILEAWIDRIAEGDAAAEDPALEVHCPDGNRL